MNLSSGLEQSMENTGAPPASASDSLIPKLSEKPVYDKKLNDSVYGLKIPNGAPDIDVIFFHGLQRSDYKDAFWRTWVSRDEKLPMVWPREWLGKEFPSSRILSISYDSTASIGDTTGHGDPYLISENLISDIIVDQRCSVGRDRPVFLVGHGLGCIIIKLLLVMCWKRKATADKNVKDRSKTFLNILKGIFYYAPPHTGANVEHYLDAWAKPNEDLLGLLKVLGAQTQRINGDFQKLEGLLKTSTQTILEGRATDVTTSWCWFWKCNKKIVEERDGRGLGGRDVFTAVEADHIDVCRPKNPGDNIFTKLVTFIDELAEHKVKRADKDTDLTV